MRLDKVYAPIAKSLEKVENSLKTRLRAVAKDNRLVSLGDSLLDKAIEHLLIAPGKRLRPALVLLGAGATAGLQEGTPTELIDIASSVELFHSASLIHDDVIDEADHRRLAASVNGKFGVKIAILAGDILYAQTFELLAGLSNVSAELKLELFRLFAQLTEKMCAGEIHEQQVVYGKSGVQRGDYISILENKTALLMALSCKCGALLAGAEENAVQACYEFGLNFGLAYQLGDDYMDQDAILESGVDLLGEASACIDRAKSSIETFPENQYTVSLYGMCDFVLDKARNHVKL